MVDVDGPALQLLAQVVGQDLHVARKHHQVDVVLLEELENLPLLLGLLFLAGWETVKRNPEFVCHRLQFGVIADH